MAGRYGRRYLKPILGTAGAIGGVLTCAKLISARGSLSASTDSETHGEHTQDDGSKLSDVEERLRHMTLKNVQVLFRHGARTPLHHLPKVEEVWYDATYNRKLLPYTNIPVVVKTLEGDPRPISPLQDKYATVKFKGGMIAGVLTSLGQDQMYQLGCKLRKEYIDKHGLIADVFSSDQVFIRSTNLDRTIESLRCVLSGLFSELVHREEALTIPVSTRDGEILIPSFRQCPLLHTFLAAGKDARNLEVKNQIKSVLGNELDIDIITFRDHISSRKAHGLHIPDFMKCLEDEIETAAIQSMMSYFIPSHRDLAAKLAIGQVLHMMQRNMEDEINNRNSQRLYLYSTHDSTVMPLLSAIKVWDGKWPPFSADLRVELWQDEKKQHWVHMRYLGESVTPEGYSTPLLSWKQFQQLISPYVLDSKTYKTSCNSQPYLGKDDDEEDESAAPAGL